MSDGEVHKLVSEVLGTVVSGASGGAIAHKGILKILLIMRAELHLAVMQKIIWAMKDAI